MDSYNKILREFNQIELQESSELDQYEINHALDTIYQKNIKNGEIFNRDVSAEIFEQTQKQSNNRVILKDFIHKILQAHQLLNKFILQSKAKTALLIGNQKEEELQLLSQYEEDYYFLTAPFQIGSATTKQSDKRVNRSNLSAVFSNSEKSSEESQTLKIVLVLALSCFVIEFFLMFVKHHFLSMMTYMAVTSIFFLNYFDKTFIRLTLYMLFGSVLFDLLWIILQADHYWNVSGPTHHSSTSRGFMRFVYIMTIILMIVKGVIAYLLLKYRQNEDNTRKTVKLFNFKFELSAQTVSPISTFIKQTLQL